jgi:hypothetical protein
VNWPSSTWQTGVSAATKQKGEEGGEDESEICTAMRNSLNSPQK